MLEMQFIQFAIDIWGSLFCVIALICIYFTRAFDKKGAGKLSLALVCCLLMLLVDAAGLWNYIGQGAAPVDERTARDLVYLFKFLILFTSVNYVSYIIFKRSGRDFNMWRIVELVIAVFGIALVGINRHIPFMYMSDSLGYYLKLDYYMLPELLLITGIVLAIGVIIDKRKYLRSVEKVAMISYMLFPALAGAVHIYAPDLMPGSFAITVSTMIMFVAYEFNYTRFYIDVERRSAADYAWEHLVDIDGKNQNLNDGNFAYTNQGREIIDSRLFLFVHRANNYVKPEAVITGGNCEESTKLGDLVMKK